MTERKVTPLPKAKKRKTPKSQTLTKQADATRMIEHLCDKMGGPGGATNAPGPGPSCVRGTNMTDRTCSVEGCARPRHARTYCTMHYQRWRVHGDPTKADYIQGDDLARFRSYVNEDGPVAGFRPDLGPCHIWTGYVLPTGYGQIKGASFNSVMAHRISYEMACGPIPGGLHLDHLCRVPACVNPLHLEPVTVKENINRGYRPFSERIRCPHGHPYAGDNLYVTPKGHRRCRECNRLRKERLRNALRGAA